MNDAITAILEKLKNAACEYELLEHPAVFTMDDVERHILVPRESRVKTMVVAAQDGAQTSPVLCGLQAAARLDVKKVAKFLGLPKSSVSMMPPAEAESVIHMPRGAIGLIAPFTSPRVLLSPFFRAQPFLCFGIGRNDRTLKIPVCDLRKAVEVTFADIERGV